MPREEQRGATGRGQCGEGRDAEGVVVATGQIGRVPGGQRGEDGEPEGSGDLAQGVEDAGGDGADGELAGQAVGDLGSAPRSERRECHP